MDMRETNKLLAKIYFELKEMNARQRKQAGEPEPERRKSEGGVASVLRDHLTGAVITDDALLPSQMSPERQAAIAAQLPGGSGKPVAKTESLNPGEEPGVVRLTREQLGHWRR